MDFRELVLFNFSKYTFNIQKYTNKKQIGYVKKPTVILLL
jgi:hypothetical protein